MKVTVIRIVIMPYSNKDLARLFKCSVKTIYRDILPFRELLGTRNGHRWNIKQVEMILDRLGRPYEYIEHDTTILELMPKLNIPQAA